MNEGTEDPPPRIEYRPGAGDVAVEGAMRVLAADASVFRRGRGWWLSGPPRRTIRLRSGVSGGLLSSAR
ncbi:MAG: hypothetical protein HY815_15385 [Candidatus Riflebacteria bacterium]|nr:hypothetical protein [Candidatus Riflebacteria bacterium]